jgi:putative transposase
MQKHCTNHRPPHLFLDNEIYFITASTYGKKPLFDNAQKKDMLRNVLREKASLFGVKIYAYAIMDSHYHLLIRLGKGKELAAFIKGVNGKSAISLKKMDNSLGHGIWYNYWDKCIRTERDFWVHYNYIHHNPVKHGKADKMEDYDYSSYRNWLERKGKEWMDGVFERYPIVDFTKGDG